LETKGIRPRLNVALSTNTLQLNDFKVNDWSLVDSDFEEETTDSDNHTQDFTDSQGGEMEPLLSHTGMQSLDAELVVKVGQVLSGEDRLGGGFVEATLEDGKLSIEPLRLDLPGGPLDMTLALDTTETDIAAKATVIVDRLDYGILARRIDPDTEMSGLISLDLDIQARAANTDLLRENASGRIVFAVWPEETEAGIFDLWALNLLTNLLPRWGGKSKSKINCIVGNLRIDDGIMQPKELVIDTTNVRVRGKGQVDFKTDTVNLVFEPRPKSPQLFSLGVPIEVSGELSDFKVGTDPWNILWFFVRVSFFIYDYAVQLFTNEGLPADGQDVCAEAISW